jgi:hypothetical protein
MRILEPGNNNRVTCQDCDSKLQFDASDVARREVPPQEQYDAEDPSDKYTVDCPSCNMVINVTDKITPGIARVIVDRERYQDYDL